jgi:hypothetical protein
LFLEQFRSSNEVGISHVEKSSTKANQVDSNSLLKGNGLELQEIQVLCKKEEKCDHRKIKY